jgi:hypothetical protein
MESNTSSAVVIGVDIGKDVFHLVGFAADGKIAFRRRIRRLDNWDVGGLRGTGSHDYAVSGLFVSEACAIPFDAAPRAPKSVSLAYLPGTDGSKPFPSSGGSCKPSVHQRWNPRRHDAELEVRFVLKDGLGRRDQIQDLMSTRRFSARHER